MTKVQHLTISQETTTMTQHELIATLASKTGLSAVRAGKYLNALTEIVTTNMVDGRKTSITGFGTFDLGKRAARRGVNPQTHQEIQIPEMAMPRFRAGKNLTAAVRGE